MPKISEYEIVNPEGDDKIIVSKTDGTPTDVTKNITVDALATYISPGGGYFGVIKLNTLKGELTIEGGTNVLVATDTINKKITIAAPAVGETYLFFSQTNTTTPENVDLVLQDSQQNESIVTLVAGTNVVLQNTGAEIQISCNIPASITYDLASAQSGTDVDVTLTGSDATTDTVKLVAGTNITLTDNGSNEVTIDADDSVTTLNGLDGSVSIVNGNNITVDVLNPSNEIQINNTLSISDLISNSSDTYTSVPEVVQVVTLTTNEYNNLVTKVPTTLYILVDSLP